MTDSSDRYGAGSQWRNIVKRLSASTVDFANFKRTPEFMMFATLDPRKFGLSYLRTLTYQLYKNLSSDEKEILRNTSNRQTGNPHSIKVGGQQVDLEYIHSATEAAFIKPIVERVSTIVEIGAGYGRTCHTILDNFVDIEHYLIVDLPYTLELSSTYLSKVLAVENFNKVQFISTEEVGFFFSSFTEKNVLFINIDSMGEMSLDVVRNYLSLIDAHGEFFFTKNTVGKYSPKDVGETMVRQSDYVDAISSGLMPSVIDVFDLDEISERTATYNKVYTPSENWRRAQDSDCDCYPHYHLTLFEKC
jgi:putative sugar O-methyltransferase